MRRRLASAAVTALLVVSTVSWSAAQADPITTWTPGPGASGDNTYDGFIDAPTLNATVATGSFNVSGWFVDKSAQGWAGADDVQVWVGTMEAGRLLSKANFAQLRPDVGAALGNDYQSNSGFFTTVPPGQLPLGPQTLSVYAHTPDKGWWFKQVTVNVSATAPYAPTPVPPGPSVTGGGPPIVAIEKPKDSETVLTRSDYEISGYALDKNAAPYQGVASTGIDRVSVYIGDRDNGGTFLGDAQLGFSNSIVEGQYGSQFASTGWRLVFHPTKFHPNTYLMYAYAHSVVTGKEEVAVRYFVIRDQSP